MKSGLSGRADRCFKKEHLFWHKTLFDKPFHFAGVRLFILIIVDSDEQQFPPVVGEKIEILPVPDLADCTVRRAVAFQLDDHGGIRIPEGDVYDVRESFSRRHFPDNRIAVQRIDVSQVNGALQGVFVVVAAVAGHMDVGDVQGFRNGICISPESFGKQFL